MELTFLMALCGTSWTYLAVIDPNSFGLVFNRYLHCKQNMSEKKIVTYNICFELGIAGLLELFK